MAKSEVAASSEGGVAVQMSSAKRSALVFAILTAVFAQMMMTYSLTTAAPAIVQELNGYQWYALMFSLATMFQCVFTPASTAIGRVFTKRRTIILGTILMVVQFLGTLLAVSVPMIIVFRCIGQTGAALLFTVGIGMFADLFPPEITPKYTGYYGSVIALCGVIGPMLAGLLVDHSTWRWLPALCLAIGLVAVGIMFYAAPKIPRRDAPESKTDLAGIITMAIAIIAIVMIISFGGTAFAWASAWTAVLAVVGVVFIVVFFNTEKKKGEDAIVPLGLLKNRVFLAGFLLGFLGDGVSYVLWIYLPAYGQYVMLSNATYAGLLVSVPSILAVVISAASGRWMAKTGRIKLIATVGICAQILCCLFACTGTPDTNRVLYLVVMTVLFGLVNGIVAFVPLALVQARMPHKHVDAATAVVMLGVTLGSTIIVALAGLVQNIGLDMGTTYRVIMIAGAVITCVVLPFLLSLPSDKKANEEIAARNANEANGPAE
jgi:MFS family permease